MALNCVCVCEFFFSQRFFTRSVNSSEKVKKKKKENTVYGNFNTFLLKKRWE